MKLFFLPLLAAILMACQQSPSPSSTPKAIGKLELTFDSQTNKATAMVRTGLQTQAVQTSSNVSFNAPSSLSVLSGGSVQYINAQFNINNLLPSTNLTDLTLIAYQKTGNIGGTALRNIYNFAGSSIYAVGDAAGIAFARGVKPSNTPNSLSPFTVNNNVSDLQLFTESEITPLELAANTAGELNQANGDYLLPYGYVARSSATSRTLLANTNNAGVVNIAIQIPTSNSSSATTGYRFSMTFIIFDAPVATRVSESLQEQGALSGATIRKTGFSASELFALGGSSLLSDPSVKRGCVLRSAGTASTPLDYLVNTFNFVSFLPSVNTNAVARDANVSLTTDQTMSAATGSSLVVRGSFTGTKAGVYSGAGSSTLGFDPTVDFMPGELVTAQTLGLTNANGGGACEAGTRTWQYRANVAARGAEFAAKTDYPTGSSPFSVVVGDVNNDTKLDIITANAGADSSSVLLGNGNGTFQTKTDYPTGTYPISVVVGDVNNDTKLDIIIANFNGASSSVLLGNGDGTFQTKTDYPTGYRPYSVVVGDVNGDAKLDIITANYGADSSSVLLGNGDGTFQTKTDYTTNANPVSVVVGDVNGDAKLDIITANSGGNSSSVLLGNGDGTFQAKTDYPTGYRPQSVVVGDVNGDAKLDIITANSAADSSSVLLGNGDGTFQAKTDYPTGTNPVSVVVGDVNGDGKLDIITANYDAASSSVLLGTGTGTFQGKTDYTTD